MWVSLKSPTDFLNKPSTKDVKAFQTPSLKSPFVALHCLPNKAQQSIRSLSASTAQATGSTRDMSYSYASNLGIRLSFHMPFPLMPGGVTWIFQDVTLLLFSLWIFGPTALRLCLNHDTYQIMLSYFKEFSGTFFFLLFFHLVPSRNSLRASFMDVWPMQSHRTTLRRVPCLLGLMLCH